MSGVPSAERSPIVRSAVLASATALAVGALVAEVVQWGIDRYREHRVNNTG